MRLCSLSKLLISETGPHHCHHFSARGRVAAAAILQRVLPRLNSSRAVFSHTHSNINTPTYRHFTTTTTANMPVKRKAATQQKEEDVRPDPTTAEDIDETEAQPTSKSAQKRRKLDNASAKPPLPSSSSSSGPSSSNPKRDYTDRTRYKDSHVEEENGIILREYYPPEMSNERANMYGTGQLERPITTLTKAIQETRAQREKIPVGDAVVHWFKCDLRLHDNKALHMASEKAKSKGVPLICVYLVSPQDFRAHLTAPVRVDFILRNLVHLRGKLADLDVPLFVDLVEKRRNVPGRLMELCEQWGTKHIYCNMEYEVDELRREAKMTRECLDKGIDFTVVHDTCVVEPGKLTTAAGGQIAVYSPWHRKWCKYINENLETLEEYAAPTKNPKAARMKFKELFDKEVPEAPEDKSLSKEDRERFEQLWPVGEEEAQARLHKFLAGRIAKYHEARNLPAGEHTSVLSPHLAAGTLAARTAVREALKASPRQSLTDDRGNGYMMWIGEVAWRDFYKHVLCNWPAVCMNKCFKPEYTDIEWEYNDEQFEAWTKGKTGYPLIDAAMRQVQHMAYMHNRVRMNVASFLAKDLMIDWRMGERWFMENLIDGDFASNNGGWGFSASCGVDPQPYFRIFNPILQSEKFDESGEYIRKWLPELRDVKGKAIHEPYARGAEAIAKKNGYPRPIVEHKASRTRALERYKAGIKRETA